MLRPEKSPTLRAWRPTLARGDPTPAEKQQKSPREGSKTAIVVALLKRESGVTGEELREATGWQAHSVRGFLSGTIVKKLGLPLVSSKSEEGERRYSLPR
jgi:hypothetical protein